MKRLLTTTAISLMLCTSAYAVSHSMKLNTYMMEQSGDIYASDFIGMRVYAAEKDFDALNDDTMIADGEEKKWDDIGEVNDVILGRDGKVKAVVLGIGGFIGIGEKDIAVNMSDIKLVQDKDDKDDFFLVVKANKQSLTDAESFKKTVGNSVDTVSKDARKKMDGLRTMLTPPMVERDGYRKATVAELTTENLTGARVYGSMNEDIGEIDRLILTTDGKIKHAIVDVGGFLGIGEHPIAVTMDELKILREDDGDDVRVYIDGTQAELKKQPMYKQ